MSCERDASGRIRRSATARSEFRKLNHFPPTGKITGACPGYAIDHDVPLYKGGADSPSNMQWLSDAQHKEKNNSLK